MKHNHYFKACPYKAIDVYRVCEIFKVTDPSGAKQHALKKVLMAGDRGSKSEYKDIREAIDTLERWCEMRIEEDFNK